MTANEINKLNADLSAAHSTIDKLQAEKDALQRRVDWLEKQVFGQKSEKTSVVLDTDSEQLGLFNEAEVECTMPAASVNVPAHTRKAKRTRKETYENLPVEEVVHHAEDSSCNTCGAEMTVIVKEFVRDEIIFVKARLFVRKHYVETFRFLEYKGVKINTSILTLPLAPANWKGSKLPVILSAAEEDRLRCHVFPDTELGARNRVILYLLLDLRLSCSEIPGIQLEDVRWNSGTIIIRNTKNGAPRELPLSQNLGRALEIYVIKHRPRYAGSYLLLNTKPCREHSPVTVGSVRSVVRNVFKQCSVSGWWKGPHSIRRTTASNIYNSGVGIKLTADILGHESLDSTTHYVRVDFTTLREICREWPGKGATR